MSTYDDLYNFLKDNYRYDRFEGRNDWYDAPYSHTVTKSHLEYLSKYGYGIISRQESKTGVPVYYAPDLTVLSRDEWLVMLKENY
jgi:hypothetical protein